MTFLLPVMEGDARVEALAQSVLDMPDMGREFHGLTTVPAASFAGSSSGEMDGDKLLGITDGAVHADKFLSQHSLGRMILDAEEDLGMTWAEPSLFEVCLYLGIEFEKTHGVGHGRAALADSLADLFLSEAEFFREAGVRGGLLDRIEALALEILDEGKLQDFLITGIADDDRGRGQADLKGGAKTSLAGNEFVLSGDKADNQRLDDATLTDRVDKLAEFLLAEFRTWLEGAGNDPIQADLLDAFTVFLRGNGGGDARGDEGAQPFAESLP